MGLITWMSTCPTRPSGCCSVPPPRVSPSTGTDAPMRLPGSHLRASMSSGLVRGPRGEESGTGTRVPVPVHMTSLLCLLSEALRGEGLGTPHPFLGATSGVEFRILLGGFTVIQYMRQSSVAFGCYFTRWTSDPEVDSRTDFGVSTSPRIRQSLVLCLGRGRCTGNSGFTGR